jgi:hypothetical protein
MDAVVYRVQVFDGNEYRTVKRTKSKEAAIKFAERVRRIKSYVRIMTDGVFCAQLFQTHTDGAPRKPLVRSEMEDLW